MKTLKYKIKTILTFSFSELDFGLYNELFGKKAVDKMYDSNGHPGDYIIDNRKHYVEGASINIDKLISKLQQFKSKGCNYVALEHHCDHIGYDLEGISITKTSNEEASEYSDKIKKRNELYKELNFIDDTYRTSKKKIEEQLQKLQ